MSEWTLEKAFKLAISMEEESYSLYTSAQGLVINPGSKKFLQELAADENRHKENIIEAMKNPDKIQEIGNLGDTIPDLKIVDGLEATSLSPEADYQEILIFAAKREKATHDFYMVLAKEYREKQVGKMFARFAKEELMHKYRLETEYDDVILWQM